MILTPMDYVSLAPRLPPAANSHQARIGLEHWAERYVRTGLPPQSDPAASESGRSVLQSLFGNSSFLGQIALADPQSFLRLVETGPEDSLRQALAETTAAAQSEDEATIMARLRRLRQRVALLVALADIAELWTVEQVTQALSDFAEAALEASIRFLLLMAERNGQIKLDGNPDNAGFVVLGMGKLGARELNYSSDIDLIVLYDPEQADRARPDAPRHDLRAPGPQPGAHAAGAHRRRLCLPHRSAPAPRSRRDAAGDLGDAAPKPTTRASARTGSAPR